MIKKSRIAKFKKWLAAHGAQILPTTNEYELLRFKCKLGTGVIYEGSKGISVSGPLVNEAYECYVNPKAGKTWKGKGNPKDYTSKDKGALLKRDGNCCFYCGEHFESDELTVEHILSRIHQGNNRIENKALACKECNQEAGHLPIVEKIKLRDLKRGHTSPQD